MELTNEQWDRIGNLVPDQVKRADGRGRPARDKREVMEAVLWVLRTGAPWKDLHGRFPPFQTCHRRFQHWQEQGVMRNVVEALAKDLMERGGVDLSECFIDGSFCMAKKGALLLARLSELMAVTDASGIILSLPVESASPHEAGLVEKVLDGRFMSHCLST